MKKKVKLHAFRSGGMAKLWRIMRLTFFIVLVGLLEVSASVYSQQTRLSLDLENCTLEDAFSRIEDNSKYVFFYNADQVQLDQIVNLNIENLNIEEILTELLKDKGISFNIIDRRIVLFPEKDNSQILNQNKKDISGNVSDSSGEGLPGVTVVVKGTTSGTITDVDGNYTLSNVSGDAVLIFSFVGMKTEEIQVAGKNKINLVMEEESIGLEEVVAVGYGTVKKIDLTGSVGKVSVNDLQKAPVKSFDDALAGRLAGVQVVTSDGQPGSLPTIVIRGGNSITQDNSPLYVVDGFPIEDNDNNAINPADIESIDVLKDASATAIYGARGANGVIIITTKRGQTGEPVVTYNGSIGWNHDTKRIDVMDAYDFVNLQLEIDSVNATNLYLVNQNMSLEDYKNVESLDWYKKVVQTALTHNHNLSITGGNKQTRYSFSGSYIDQSGIFTNTGFKRYQGRLSLDQTINEKIKVGINTNYSEATTYGVVVTDYDGGAGAAIMLDIWGYRPVLPNDEGIDAEDMLIDPSINTSVAFRVNPLLQLENALREKISKNLLANSYVEYEVIPNLKLKVTGGMNSRNFQRNVFNNSSTRTGSTYFPFSLGVNGSETFTNSVSLSNENTLTYNLKIKKHKFTLLGGYSQQTNKTSVYGATANQIPNEELGLSGIDEGTPSSINSSVSEWALQSFIGRINYNYKSKYYFTSSFRADGSSKFAPGHRWAYFPSGAIAYRLSEEKFMKPLNFLSNLKLRASWGLTGNNRVSDFAYLSSVDVNVSNRYSFGNQTPSQASIVGSLGNPALKWETTEQYDVGLDIGLWKNRLDISADYYYKKTNDLLLRAELPNSSGYLRAFKNIGSVSNEGFEFSINSVNIERKNFSWTTNLNMSFNSSEVLSLAENQDFMTTSMTVSGSTNNALFIAKIGEPIAQFYGLIYEGTYKYDDFNLLEDGTYVIKDEIPGNGGVRNQIQPGDAKYKDVNGDLNITANDYTVIGNPNPDFIGGLNNNFHYKSFDLGVFLQFSYGNDIFNANRVLFENGRFIDLNRNQYASLNDRWTVNNPESNMPALNRLGGNFYSSRTVEDGSYLRLKTVSLGYNFSNRIINRLKIKSLRVYCSAQNLLTWTKYSGLTPDVSTRNSTLTPGFDISPYPVCRTITFGTEIKF
ncbi:TonB-dependent receptor [Sunxiuqinia sp. A32]|uniref:TonB-dependent receptor n=1 Tax=Sunxiuqinia sp. A32 TaxID=3461496 RepID=UPI0040459C3A